MWDVSAEKSKQPDLNRKLSLAHSHVQDLYELIEKAGTHDFPSASPAALLALLRKIVDVYREKITIYDNQLKRTLTEDVSQVLSLRLSGVAHAAVQLANIIRYVEGASVENVPWGLYGQFQQLCKQFDPNSHIIIRPRFRFRYDYKEAKNEIRIATQSDPDIELILKDHPNFIILSFPITERNNMLKNAVWGHEIGHILQQHLTKENHESVGYHKTSFSLADDTSLASKIAEEIEIDKESLDRLKKLVSLELGIVETNDSQNEFYEELSNEVYLRVAKTRENWVTEIICDLLGIRFFGPAALFAFCEFVEPLFNLSVSNDTHPSPAMRMLIMVKELEELGYINLNDPNDWKKEFGGYGVVLGQEISYIKSVSENALAEEVKISPPEREIRYEIINQALNPNRIQEISKIVRNVKRDYFADPQKLRREVPPLVKFLEKGIPPNKIELNTDDPDPASLPAILNAGWIYWLETLHQNRINHDNIPIDWVVDERDRLNKLVLKGIEASDIQWRFEQLRNLGETLK